MSAGFFYKESFFWLVQLLILSFSSYSIFLAFIMKERRLKFLGFINTIQLFKFTFFFYALVIYPAIYGDVAGATPLLKEIILIEGVMIILCSWLFLKLGDDDSLPPLLFTVAAVSFGVVLGLLYWQANDSVFQKTSLFIVASSYLYVLLSIPNLTSTLEKSPLISPRFFMGSYLFLSTVAFLFLDIRDDSILFQRISLICAFLLLGLTTLILKEMQKWHLDQISVWGREREFTSQLVRDLEKATTKAKVVEQITPIIANAAIKLFKAAGAILWLKDSETGKEFKAASMVGKYPPLYPVKGERKTGGEKTSSKIMEMYMIDMSYSPYSKAVMEQKFREGETYAGQVAKTRKAILYSDLMKKPNNLILQTAKGAVDIDSIIAAPIMIEGQCKGVLSVIRTPSSSLFNKKDLALMSGLVDQASITLNRFQVNRQNMDRIMHQTDVAIAAEVQSGLLPKEFKGNPRLDFYGFSKPAQGVGGDYFDYRVYSEDQIAFIMSDVAGKGASGSLIVVMIRSIFNLSANEKMDPVEVVRRINYNLANDLSSGKFATLLYYVLDTQKNEITYSNAAHLPLLVYHSKEDSFEELDTDGIPAGVDKNSSYEQKVSKTSSGDILLLLTDGISEAMGIDESQYGVDRLKDIVRKHWQKPAKELCKQIEEDIVDFVGADHKLHDDETLFLCKIL